MVKNNQKGRLSPYGSNSGPESFAELLHQPHGLIASYLAPHLVDPKGKEFKKQEVLAHAATYIEAMQSSKLRETMNGRGAVLTCFAGAKNEFLLPLYKRDKLQLPLSERKKSSDVRGAGDFEGLTKKLIEVCEPSVLRNMPDTFVQSLGLLIRELFENTEDHATTDEVGQDYSWAYPNVRAILAKYISFSPRAKDAIASFGDVAHKVYFQKALLNFTASKTLDFIELTVVDCGRE